MGSAVLAATRCHTADAAFGRDSWARFRAGRPRIARPVSYRFSTLLANAATIPVRAASSLLSATFKALLHDIRLEVSDGQ
jgi:hypothetical protein